jgi:hypothetical protein
MNVFAAWNGATEVSRWAVLAGNHRSRLRIVKVAANNGFETAIAVGARMRYVAVSALDTDGHQLGISETIAT